MYTIPTNPVEIKYIIQTLQSKLSSGIDSIPTKLLKSTPDNMLIAISHVFNLSFTTGTFINEFKVAKVIPIFKKGNTEIMSNYRPISLLPSMSKILEKLMHKRLYSFLNGNDFFHKNQFGFRKQHSTNHATTILIQEITDHFENKDSVLGIFLDLSKAFDTIDHSLLISKLHHYGIRGTVLDWFINYLCGRTQFVQYGETLSSFPQHMIHGVPQGSILGPLLFLILMTIRDA
jgi:hypothetical protein